LHIAKNQGAEWTFLSSTTDPIPQVKDITEGLGADAVLHCGKSEVADSLVQALEMAREKGNVVLVGSVPIELPRTPMFRKELNVIVSRSTGPGRYDPHYEREGSDYPPAYVRWTGRRNLAECARLISAGKMGMENLITHEFGFDSAEEAFEHVVDQGAKTLGVLLRYPAGEDA
jgi:threonine dehydrogenase-like Zn-dependent dehydrogenase